MSSTSEHAIDVGPVAIAAIVERFQLGTRSWAPLASLGASTSVFTLGEAFVLRVPHNTPEAVAGIAHDQLAIPAARAAGVRTPALVAVDTACDLLPVPYGIYERVQGEPLDRLGLPRAATPDLWQALGHDLALLHQGVARGGPADGIPVNPGIPDPLPWLDEVVARGVAAPDDVAWLQGWLARLAPWSRPPVPPRFCHGDVNASNIMVDPTAHSYLALIDWGGAHWGDPAWDFVPVSLYAVPPMLAGYRAVAPLDDDRTAEARILWLQAVFVAFGLWRGQARGAAWAAERVLNFRRDVDQFLAAPETSWIAALP